MLTELVDSKGAPVVGAVHLERTDKDSLVINQIASVYGREPASQVVSWIGSGLLRDAHPQKSRA